MRKIIILFFVLSSLVGRAQVYQAMPQYGYGPVKRFDIDSSLTIPTTCGVPSLRTTLTKKAAVAYDSCNKRFYYYDPKLLAWDTIKGGGAVIDTTSLSNRINDKIDSIRRVGTQVSFKKNGTWYNAYTDSVGSGQNGRWGNDTATIVLAKVHNGTGTTLSRGTVVMMNGATGDVASVIRANNKYDSTSARTIGVVKDAIAAGDTGWVVTQGQASKLNLGAYTAGDVLYLDSIDGGLTKTKPQAPNHIVFIGIVERANNGNGLLYTKPQNGYELDEIHDVRITSPINNQVLVYSDTQKLWKNRNVYSIVDTTSLSNRINAKPDRNPTTYWLPFNNGTGFSDSYLLADTPNNILKTQYQGNDIGLKLDFGNGIYIFGNTSNNNVNYFTLGLNSLDIITDDNQTSVLQTQNVNIKLGDVSSTYNGTSFYIDDVNQLIKTSNAANDIGLKLDFANNNYTFGDPNIIGNYVQIDNAGNYIKLTTSEVGGSATTLYIDDNNQTIKTQNQGTDIGLKLDFAGDGFTFGDPDINGNYVQIDNSANIVQMSSTDNGIRTDLTISGTNRTIKTYDQNNEIGLSLDFANNNYNIGTSTYNFQVINDSLRINGLAFQSGENVVNVSNTNKIGLVNIAGKMNKSDSTLYQTKYRTDTMRTNIYNQLAQELNVADTANMLRNYQRTSAFPVATFGAGSGAAGDTSAFSTSTLYGSFYLNAGADTIIVTGYTGIVQGTSASVTPTIWFNDSLNVTAGATKIVNSPSAVTSTTTGNTVTSLDNTKIPPGNFVWVTTGTVTTKPTYFNLTLIGYRKR